MFPPLLRARVIRLRTAAFAVFALVA